MINKQYKYNNYDLTSFNNEYGLGLKIIRIEKVFYDDNYFKHYDLLVKEYNSVTKIELNKIYRYTEKRIYEDKFLVNTNKLKIIDNILDGNIISLIPISDMFNVR